MRTEYLAGNLTDRLQTVLILRYPNFAAPSPLPQHLLLTLLSVPSCVHQAALSTTSALRPSPPLRLCTEHYACWPPSPSCGPTAFPHSPVHHSRRKLIFAIPFWVWTFGNEAITKKPSKFGSRSLFVSLLYFVARGDIFWPFVLSVCTSPSNVAEACGAGE